MPNIPGSTQYVTPQVWNDIPKMPPVHFLYLAYLKWGYDISRVSYNGNDILVSLYSHDMDVFEEAKLTPKPYKR